MKKTLSIMLVICMIFALAACGKDAGGQNAATTAPPASKQSDSNVNGQEFKETKAAQEGKNVDANQGIDVDLTKLSGTMVYSEVYNMLSAPENYIGRTVKMNGSFNLYCQKTDENGEPDLNYPIYYACVIADATACCSQGLEFVLDGNFAYPDDYPELGDNITVTGTFETYKEDGTTYCHLVDAKMTV